MGCKTINERGSDRTRLLNWLTQPKQGVRESLAEIGIKDFEFELQAGNDPHMTCRKFRKLYEKVTGNPRFPESFWIDNYVLYWCKLTEEHLVSDGAKGLLSGLKTKQVSEATRILDELKSKQENSNRSLILTIIISTLLTLNLITLWIH